MGNSSSRFPPSETDTIYPQTRPTRFFNSTRRKRSRGVNPNLAWPGFPPQPEFQVPAFPYNGSRTRYPQTRPTPSMPQPQLFSGQSHVSSAQSVPAPSFPFAPVVGQPGSTPVIPASMPVPQNFQPTVQPMPQPRPQLHPQPGPGMTMPVPQVAASGSNGPVYPPPPIITNPSPNPAVVPPRQATPVPFPSPQVPDDPTFQTGIPLAPGQYGPRDISQDSRDRSRTPSPEPRRHRHRHRRGYSEDDYRRRHNPLPEPPRDLFERSPYVTLLHDLKLPPEESTFKKYMSSAPHAISVTPAVAVAQPQVYSDGAYGTREKKPKKGLFRSLSSRLGSRHRDPPPIYTLQPMATTAPPIVVPAPPPERTPGGHIQYMYHPLPTVHEDGVRYDNGTVPRVIPSLNRSVTPTLSNRMRSPSPAPRARTPTPSPPIKIDHENHLSGLVHDSPHPVNYDRKVYPTAYHLFEALKFMDGHSDDIAERIRTTGRGPGGVEAARQIAEQMRDAVRPDWHHIVIGKMEEVLYHKFVQHPDLRRLLLSTGDADLLYASHDDFWGDGPIGQGANELGKALVRVREQLRNDGYTVDN